MPPHRKPRFPYKYDVNTEIAHLNAHFRERGVPRKSRGETLVASWNIANLGDPKQVRRVKDYRLIAHILKRFDVVAIQEIKDDLTAFLAVLKHLGERYTAVFTDPAGNRERMGFIYDRRRIQTRQLYAELALVDRGRKTIKVEFRGKELNFHGFNRNPFMVAFAPRRPGRRKTFDFTLVNVHLYYGAAGGRKLRNRLLEVMALTKWAQKRTNTKTVYDDNIILLGDMNLPSLKSRDLIYRALKRRGLSLTKYSTDVDKEGTNLSGSHPYDQIAFFPQKTGQDYTGETGVFDFDSALFPDLYDEGRGLKRLRAYLKYYISDHRLLWAAFKA